MGTRFEQTFLLGRQTNGQQAHEKLFNEIVIREHKSKPQGDSSSHPLGWLELKQTVTSLGKDVANQNPVHGWCYKPEQSHQKTVQESLIILYIQLSHQPEILILGICTREVKTYVHTKICKKMFMIALLILVKM